MLSYFKNEVLESAFELLRFAFRYKYKHTLKAAAIIIDSHITAIVPVMTGTPVCGTVPKPPPPLPPSDPPEPEPPEPEPPPVPGLGLGLGLGLAPGLGLGLAPGLGLGEGVPCVQFAVTVTAVAGIVNVVDTLLSLARVTPPDVTVQPANVQPVRVPAFIVTSVPGTTEAWLPADPVAPVETTVTG